MNQPSKSLGVIGLGGLGHMAFKFGKAFGLKVTVFRRVNRREFKPLISSAQIKVYIFALDLLISELSSNSLIVINSIYLRTVYMDTKVLWPLQVKEISNELIGKMG
jgi:hypothetical protein